MNDEHIKNTQILENKIRIFYMLHHISPLFTNWNFLVQKKKKDNYRTIILLRCQIHHITSFFFLYWKKQIILQQQYKFLFYHQKLQRYMISWKKKMNQNKSDHHNFKKLVCKRRYLYKQNFFRYWKKNHQLFLQYQNFNNNEAYNQHLLMIRIIKAIQIIQNRNNILESNFYQMKGIHVSYQIQSTFHFWKKRINLNPCFNYIKSRTRYLYLELFLSKWWSQYKKVTKIRKALKKLNWFMTRRFLRKAFNIWINSYDLVSYIKKCQNEFNEIHYNIQISSCFRIWKKAYKKSLLDKEAEESLIDFLYQFRLEKSFSIWFEAKQLEIKIQQQIIELYLNINIASSLN